MQKLDNNINMSEEVKIVDSGKKVYNYFRNCDVRVYTDAFSGCLSLYDKKCLALYLSFMYNQNFFSNILKELGYTKFTNFSYYDTSIQYYENEFQEFVDFFPMKNNLEVVILYLLEVPLINGLLIKEGYSTSKIKLEVCNYYAKRLCNMMINIENTESEFKVLTK